MFWARCSSTARPIVKFSAGIAPPVDSVAFRVVKITTVLMTEPSTSPPTHTKTNSAVRVVYNTKHCLMKTNRLKAKTAKPLADPQSHMLLSSARSENNRNHYSFLPFLLWKKVTQDRGQNVERKYLDFLPCLAKINSNDSSHLHLNLLKKNVKICNSADTYKPFLSLFSITPRRFLHTFPLHV